MSRTTLPRTRLAAGIPTKALRLVQWADVILVSSSAGKDSLALLWHVYLLAKAAGVTERILVVHCDLGRVEWGSTRELAEQQARALGLDFIAVTRNGGDLLQQVRDRHVRLVAKAAAEEEKQGLAAGSLPVAPAWFSSAARYCTSNNKRDVVAQLMAALQEEHRGLGRPLRILNCMGQRAAESKARAKKLPLVIDKRASTQGRTVVTWMPVHHLTDAAVWRMIHASGLPYSGVYDTGMRRLSCVFCMMATFNDLVLAARQDPELAAEYVKVEQETGSTFKRGLSMADVLARALELNATEGPVRLVRGAAMAEHLGWDATSLYLAGLGLAA